MLKPINHILVIRLSAMGDVAMTAPILRQLSSQYPELKITVLTRGFFKPFFRDIPNVTVFEADVKGKHKGIFGLYRLSKELKKLKIDAVADLHNVLRSKILKRFIKGVRFIQIDKGRSGKKALVSGKVFKQLKTTHQRYADVFEALGFELDITTPTFPQKISLPPKLNDLLGNSLGETIGIAPFAAFKSKVYPIELMEEVIARLCTDNKVLLFGGGKSEIDALEVLASKHNNTVNLAGKLSLNEELDVISNLDVMISMDSGNAHIAAMLGIEVVTIWGVTHPYAGFYPFNQKEENALLADRTKYPLIPTSVYGNKHPEGYEEAISSISPKDIISKVHSIIKNAPLKK